jgi:hypothetical protein
VGAWGPGPFDNDDASDFASRVADEGDLALIEASFDKVVAAGTSYLEAPAACDAVAGAEILAMLLDRPSEETEYPDDIEEWASESEHVPTAALLAKAVQAMDRVLTPPSELVELWTERDDLDDWKESVQNVKTRLSAGSA